MSEACYCRLDDKLLEGLEKGSHEALTKLNLMRVQLVAPGAFSYPEWVRETMCYPIPMQARVRIANARKWIKDNAADLQKKVDFPETVVGDTCEPAQVDDDAYLNDLITTAQLPDYFRRLAFRIKRAGGMRCALDTVSAWTNKENTDGIQDEGSLQDTISR